MGVECARHGWIPGLILCSTAVRTRQTLEELARGFAAAGAALPEPRFEPALYLAEPARLLEEVSLVDAAVASVMLIGHNPGLHELAAMLAGNGAAEARARLAARFPTCALAVISFGMAGEMAGWENIARTRGRLDHLIFPKDLDRDADQA